MLPIYLDYAASTPLDPRVVRRMYVCLHENDLFGNPSSLHYYGKQAKEAVETARAQVAHFIAADSAEIIFTSGATEANNLALKGGAELYQRRGNHIITMQTEHKAILDVCLYLEKKGYQVTYLAPESNGCLNLDQFRQAIRPDTILVSIMHVNNETGIVQNLKQIAEITSSHQILLHVDAAQSPGKAMLNVKEIPIDMLSLCAHKAYGPKGIGALYLRKKPRIRVEALFHGGGHEQGMRSGTLATHQIVGMGEAFALMQTENEKDFMHIKRLRDRFLSQLKIENMQLNTDLKFAVPHILNLRFDSLLADLILTKIPHIAASTASACRGDVTEGSHVLRALGLTLDQVKSSIRFSFGRFTTEGEIDEAAQSLIKAVM